MKLSKFIFTAMLLLATSLIACQKVIDIDLNDKEPKIVIEGGISDQAGPYVIYISQTVNFDETNSFPAIRGAHVTLHDDAGNGETLVEVAPGTYETQTIQGMPGRTYTLEVTVNNVTYTSVSYMPEPVDIDSLRIEETFWGGRVVTLYLKDPTETENFYRIVQDINSIRLNDIMIMSDELQNGATLNLPLITPVSSEDSLRTNDTVLVHLQSIDKPTYDYFRTLMMLTSAAGPPSDAPANPISGFTNGALGYFSAYAVRSKSILVP